VGGLPSTTTPGLEGHLAGSVPDSFTLGTPSAPSGPLFTLVYKTVIGQEKESPSEEVLVPVSGPSSDLIHHPWGHSLTPNFLSVMVQFRI
jgi:hypothetical protein